MNKTEDSATTHAQDDVKERAPVVTVYGYRITEADVRDALKSLGDEALADYDSGRLPRAKAYDIARRSVKTLIEWGCVRVGGVWARRTW